MWIYVLALLIGVVAGLRTLTAPAAVNWAAHLGWLHLQNTWLAFLGAATPYIFSLFALAELVTDKLPGVLEEDGVVLFALTSCCCRWRARASVGVYGKT